MNATEETQVATTSKRGKNPLAQEAAFIKTSLGQLFDVTWKVAKSEHGLNVLIGEGEQQELLSLKKPEVRNAYKELAARITKLISAQGRSVKRVTTGRRGTGGLNRPFYVDDALHSFMKNADFGPLDPSNPTGARLKASLHFLLENRVSSNEIITPLFSIYNRQNGLQKDDDNRGLIFPDTLMMTKLGPLMRAAGISTEPGTCMKYVEFSKIVSESKKQTKDTKSEKLESLLAAREAISKQITAATKLLNERIQNDVDALEEGQTLESSYLPVGSKGFQTTKQAIKDARKLAFNNLVTNIIENGDFSFLCSEETLQEMQRQKFKTESFYSEEEIKSSPEIMEWLHFLYEGATVSRVNHTYKDLNADADRSRKNEKSRKKRLAEKERAGAH